jgi:hypothetical protein
MFVNGVLIGEVTKFHTKPVDLGDVPVVEIGECIHGQAVLPGNYTVKLAEPVVRRDIEVVRELRYERVITDDLEETIAECAEIIERPSDS